MSNLISQKASIEAQKREMERWEERERVEREETKAKARERVIQDFEKGMALGGTAGRGIMRNKEAEKKGENDVGSQFKLDVSIVEKATREAEEKAMKVLEEEQTEARKAKLAAFWLPSLTPEAKMGPMKDIKLQTFCHVGAQPHPIS